MHVPCEGTDVRSTYAGRRRSPVRSVIQGELEVVANRVQIQFRIVFPGNGGRLVQLRGPGEELVKSDVGRSIVNAQSTANDTEVLPADGAGRIIIETGIAAFIALHAAPPATRAFLKVNMLRLS